MENSLKRELNTQSQMIPKLMLLIECFCPQNYNSKDKRNSKSQDDKLGIGVNQDYFIPKNNQKDEKKYFNYLFVLDVHL